MNEPDPNPISEKDLARVVWVSRGFIVLLAVAPLAMLAIFTIQHFAKSPLPGTSPVLLYIALPLSFVFVIARRVAVSFLVRMDRRTVVDGSWRTQAAQKHQGFFGGKEFLDRNGDRGRLCLTYFASTVLAAAFIEASAVAMALFYMIQKDPMLLVFGALNFLGFAGLWPTIAGLSAWLEQQSGIVVEEAGKKDGK